jgi:hypothetical protein
MNASTLFRILGLLALVSLLSTSVVLGQTAAPALSPAIAPQSPRIPVLGAAITPASKGALPSASLYNSGDPSADEQYYLELLNYARMHPAAAGDAISKTTDKDVTDEFNYWATQDADEPTRARIKSEFATYDPKQPLAMNASLLTAARAHSQDMLDHNYQGHEGTDGSLPWDRAKKAGYASMYVGENAAAYAKTVYDAYAGWLIDFGVPNDTQWGHRNNCLEFLGGANAVSYTEVGPGMIPGGTGFPDVGPLVSTLDLGDAGKHFILGVVYNDVNKNGSYDRGEGVSGVTINVSSGSSYYAVSATQGGYAIPVTGSGTVNVTATGGPFGTTGTTQSVELNGENVKVDFVANGLPGSVVLEAPPAHVGGPSVKFIWMAQAGATHYHLQVGIDSAMTKSKLIFNDSTSLTGTATSKSVPGFKDSTVYYWRMRAQNSKGWGAFGPLQSFTVYLPLPTVALVSPVNGSMVDPDNTTLVWNRSGARASNYMVKISTSSAMTTLVDSQVINADPTGFNIDSFYAVPVGKLQGNKTYYWMVLVQDEGAWSAPQTPIHSFTTGASGVEDEDAADQTLMVSPNPASNVAHFRFELEKPEYVLCKLYNNVGDAVRTYQWGTLTGSTQDLTVELNDLPAGNYGYVLHVGDQVRTGRLVIVK